jgi:hypothetical protein
MSPLQRVVKSLGVLCLVLAAPSVALSQSTNYYAAQGGEFAPAGPLAGDQINAQTALATWGGFLVWQDNITDGDGFGISAVRLDSSFSPTLGNFRVNQAGAGDQENPQVALLKGGGAVFVWQSGQPSFQHIFARFLNSSNLWVTGDVMVNSDTNHYQISPAVAVLTNGNVIVTWASFGQDNADGLQGVYAQLLSPTGQQIGGEFLVNQFTPYNQRTPAVAAFPNGNFIITWISELQRFSQSAGSGGYVSGTAYNSVDVYARIFNPAGTATGSEFLVNTGTNTCADPQVAAATDGTYTVVWGQRDKVTINNSWDIFARQFNAAGVGGTVEIVNTQLYGDQFNPRIAAIGTDYLVVWTSLGQDGSKEGVFGQVLHGDGSQAGGEFQVNTSFLNAQKFQSVASDGVGRFFVVWSSYVGGVNSLDLYAQRYATTLQPLSPPGAPIVTPVNSSRLTIAWAPLAGFNVSNYDLYIDGSTAPIIVTNIMWSMTGLAPDSTHTFILDYVLVDGRRSPQSSPGTGTTWGSDDNSDGLPDDWQTMYWGSNYQNWPPSNTKLTPHGPTILQVFQWGGNPFDSSTWLTTTISQTSEGWFLDWNTKPGSIYQVQSSVNLSSWTNVGSPRFAAGTTDSIFLGISNNGLVSYRIERIRY